MSSAAAVQPDSAEVSGDSAFVRLWLGFATARVCVGLALLLLLAGLRILGNSKGVSGWVLGMCATYFLAALAVRLLMRPTRPGKAFDPQWVSSIGVDLLVFGALELLQVGNIYYAPLFAVPVLMASVLGSRVLALGTAAGAALLVLAQAWVIGLLGAADLPQRFLQAGLSGTGFFALAFLAHQLALRLQREEAAARSSRKAAFMQAEVNQLVIETLGDGVLVLDADGHVYAANPAARELLGAPAASGALQLSLEPTLQPLAEMARRTFATSAAQLADLTLDTGEGPGRRVFARTRLTTSAGQPGDALCVLFLQDLREMEARLRTEKLAAMGRMSTAVAHEIRNPLAAISQANELLAEDLADPAQRQLSDLVRQNAQRLAQIVEEILDVARVQHQGANLSRVSLDLEETVRQHARDWTAQNRCEDHLQLLLRARSARVVFDPDHLRRVLVNLLDNARRYASGEPGSIQVATDAGIEAILTVWSDGPALEAAVERHLFEPFFSSESRSSGLGLFICRELCERHGARIGYRRGPAPAGDHRHGNAFFVAFRTGAASAAPGPFATIAA
jgi:two-component system sensor histidine kinase PilS (NtrC family)